MTTPATALVGCAEKVSALAAAGVMLKALLVTVLSGADVAPRV